MYPNKIDVNIFHSIYSMMGLMLLSIITTTTNIPFNRTNNSSIDDCHFHCHCLCCCCCLCQMKSIEWEQKKIIPNETKICLWRFGCQFLSLPELPTFLYFSRYQMTNFIIIINKYSLHLYLLIIIL